MKTIRKKILALLFILISMLYGQIALAAMINIELDASRIKVGDFVNFDINISGLGEGVAPSVGAYDLDFLFDSNIIKYQSTFFGDSDLGNQLDLFNLGSIQNIQELVDAINVFELSLDSSSDLLNLQADTFTLFSLNFAAISAGTTQVSTGINALGDQLGDSLSASVNSLDFSVIKNNEPKLIPTLTEWGIFFLSGLMMLVCSRSFVKPDNQRG